MGMKQQGANSGMPVRVMLVERIHKCTGEIQKSTQRTANSGVSTKIRLEHNPIISEDMWPGGQGARAMGSWEETWISNGEGPFYRRLKKSFRTHTIKAKSS